MYVHVYITIIWLRMHRKITKVFISIILKLHYKIKAKMAVIGYRYY